MRCSAKLRLEGKPYPRTCERCGLGPCKDIAPPKRNPEIIPVGLDESLDRDTRQRDVLAWAHDRFGDVVDANNIGERCRRFLEEALELCQSLGMSSDEAAAVASRVFSRPAGETVQEAGGVMVTLMCLCERVGVSLPEAEDLECKRIATLPREHFRKSQTEKRDAGL